MNFTVDDAVHLHHNITSRLKIHTPDEIHAWLATHDPELLALALTLHTLKTQSYHTA